jgi:hypothetical protein
LKIKIDRLGTKRRIDMPTRIIYHTGMNYLSVKLALVSCICIALWNCASIPQSTYVHGHMDKLWGITRDELLKTVPQEYLTYATIGSARVVLKSIQTTSYGRGVMVPVLNESVTYLFHNSRLYRIIIESSTNEYSDDKLKTRMYMDFSALAERYRKLCGEPATQTDNTTPLARESGQELVCGKQDYEWNADPDRAELPLIMVRLQYSCSMQPIVVMRLEETYTHTGLAPAQ